MLHAESLTNPYIRATRLTIALIALAAALAGGCSAVRPPTQEPTPVAAQATATALPLATMAAGCVHLPTGGFADVWHNEQVYPRLGCALAPAETASGTEAYLCDGTHSLWLREQRLFVAIPTWPQTWRSIADESGLPEDTPLMVEPVPRPAPCFASSGRHGWLAQALHPEPGSEWRARSSEEAFSGVMQAFSGGWLLWNGNVCFVLFADGTRIIM